MAISTAVTVVDPSRIHIVPEPIGLPDKIAQAYSQAMEQMQTLLETPEVQARFAHVMLSQLRSKPALLNCTPQSIVLGIIAMAEHGLDPSVANECWLIPYKGEATMQTGYGGLIKLALSHPDVLDIWADEVCENDTYEYYGVNARPKHVYPAKFAPRGRYIGYYAVALLSGNRVRAVQKSVEEIQAHAKRFSQRWDKESWSEGHGGGFRGMAIKTVLRMMCNTKYLPMAGKVAALLRTMDTIEGTIDADRDEQRAQERRRLEAGHAVEDHIEHLTGIRPKNGAIHDHTAPLPPGTSGAPRQYAVTPQGTIPTQPSELAIEVQITDLLYAQGRDDAGVAAWWQEQRSEVEDISPGYLNYLYEQLLSLPVPPATVQAPASAAPDDLAIAWRALAQAQEALGWTEQEKKLWERKQARRFKKTYGELPLETVRGLITELEDVHAKKDPVPETLLPEPLPEPETEPIATFAPEDSASVRDELAWFAEGLQDARLKADVVALLEDAETPLETLEAKRTEVQQRLAQEDVQDAMPF